MTLKLTSPSDFSLSFFNLLVSLLQGIRGSSGREYQHPIAFKEMQQKQKPKTANEIVCPLQPWTPLQQEGPRLSTGQE